LAAFKAQPKELTIIEALRQATKDVFTSLPAEKMTLEQERSKLLREVAELRGALLEEMVRNIDLLADMIGERLGRDPEDLAVRNLAGAVIGVGLAAMLRAYARPEGVGPVDAFDMALENLSNGLLQ
jgi:predicted nuclease with TOPRIM domain